MKGSKYMDLEQFASSYTTPLGTGALYPPPPYHYRGMEDVFVYYEADPERVRSVLPPRVDAADDIPICIAWTRWVPFSTFGPYHEAFIMIRVVHDETEYLYQPFIFTDNEVPLAAGREIWGFPKKLAVMSRSWAGGATFGEQLAYTVERPRGVPIMTVTMSCDQLADPNSLRKFPVLTTRVIPSADDVARPSIAELVSVQSTATIHSSADGTPQLWTGRASVTMPTVSASDPWHQLTPRRILAGYFGIYDLMLPLGRVVHDYLRDRD
ncbi:MAG: hypothetical protein F2763_00315 [Actinobacteria bacterium]|nr:hypothetical protein [Actinomycetota bacterium]